MTKHKKDIWWIAALLLMLLFSGCGGHTSGATTSTPTPIPASGSIVSTRLATTGCGKAAPIAQGTSADFTLTSGGLQRAYRLHIPIGYDPQKLTPLVLSIHGYRGNSSNQESRFGQSPQADQQHFLVVYPQGTLGPEKVPAWSTYGKFDPTVNDVLFFSDLLTSLQQRLCVDPQRIYAIGVSNGGGMVNLLACQMSERIAAFVLVSAAIYPIPGGCHPTRPVPYLEFHGTSDPLVNYNGSKPGRSLDFAPIMQTMQDWATRDDCTGGPTIFFQQADVTGFQWTGCQDNVAVEHYKIDGGGHAWPGMQNAPANSPLGKTTQTISATELSWAFFQHYQLS